MLTPVTRTFPAEKGGRRLWRRWLPGLLLGFFFLLSPAPSHAANGDTVLTVKPPINTNMCRLEDQVAFDQARQLLINDQLARDEQYMRFNVSGSHAANCINQFISYIRRIDSAVSNILTVAGSTSVVAAAITLLATQIVEAVLNQILEAINNQVCAITNEVMGALDSAVQNAICLPRIGGLGDLGFNVSLDLGRTQCNGFAINPVSTVVGAGAEADDGFGGTAMSAPILSGSPIQGLGGGIAYNSQLPPAFRTELPDSEAFFDYYEGDDIGQASDDASVGSVGSGNSRLDIAAAIAALRRNARVASTGYCATFVRLALEAGGLNTVGHPVWARNYGPFLESRGFSQVSTSGYVPQAGDIAVMPPYPGGKPYGHIAMFDGTRWISDFSQRDMFGGPGYRNNGQVAIYRP